LDEERFERCDVLQEVYSKLRLLSTDRYRRTFLWMQKQQHLDQDDCPCEILSRDFIISHNFHQPTLSSYWFVNTTKSCFSSKKNAIKGKGKRKGRDHHEQHVSTTTQINHNTLVLRNRSGWVWISLQFCQVGLVTNWIQIGSNPFFLCHSVYSNLRLVYHKLFFSCFRILIRNGNDSNPRHSLHSLATEKRMNRTTPSRYLSNLLSKK